MMRFKRLVAGCVLAAIVVGCSVERRPREWPASSTASHALADYVAKADDSYEWQVRGRYLHPDAEVLELTLQSQTWQGGLWQHQLLLIKPRVVDDASHGLLIIGGGRWRDEYASERGDEPLPDSGELFVGIATEMRSIVAVLGQVPYQPLFDLTEDRLIAYTFDQYLQTGDREWPLLLPMVKSAVRALDAAHEAAGEEWDVALERFTVIGGSKRGWTTWLLAAVEPRVSALAPIVIDALNMEKHFPHQSEVWGRPSEAIRPYTDLNLPDVLASDEGRALREIVDPYAYRRQIAQPTLVILATNDAYFPLDSANLYWQGLTEPKYLLYMPNEPHSIENYAAVFSSVRALYAAAGGGVPLPQLEWEYQWRRDALSLCVRAAPVPTAVRVWTAASADRDFRDARWSAQLPPLAGEAAAVDILRPADGYVAVFGELVFGRGESAYSLSTNVAVLPSAGGDEIGPRPSSSRGVCAAARAARPSEAQPPSTPNGR
jgi:PhoPQ-activated pathogenicity-related protein